MRDLLKKLDKIIEFLLEAWEDRKAEKEALEAEKREEERVEHEKLLVEQAKSKIKEMPVGDIRSSRESNNAPINTGGELIPFGLSREEVAILRDFYDNR
ncbi:MAG TPA: hypothetical protein PL028_04475 [Bacteroidales bacterium]|jgi:hypothetical protein|nr:hypothetical protein [Bacteroidales bacterium]